MRSIGLFRFVEESQCFFQRGFTARAFSYVFCKYGKALISLLSSCAYNCFGICAHLFVILSLYFVMYCYKSREQVTCWSFRIVVQSLVLLLCGKQYYEKRSAIWTFCEMYNQLLLLRRIGLPFTCY